MVIRIPFFIVIYLYAVGTSVAQNLIPNPYFEDTLTIQPTYNASFGPDGAGTISYAFLWTGPGAGTSADLFLGEYYYGPDFGFHIPDNWLGYQFPKVGNNYAGIILNQPGSEYLETPVSSTLEADSTYLVRFFLSSGGGPGNPINNQLPGIGNLGVYFSPHAIRFNHTPEGFAQLPLRYTPQLVTPVPTSGSAGFACSMVRCVSLRER